MKIEILIFDGCPNSGPAEKLVREVVDALTIRADIEIVKIVGNEDALAKKFLGSPSIRIDGVDLEIVEDALTQYSMRCRIYRAGDRQSGLPSRALLVEKLQEA